MSSITNINFKSYNVAANEQSSPKKADPIGKVALTSLTYYKTVTADVLCFATVLGATAVTYLGGIFIPCALITNIFLIVFNFKEIGFEVSMFFNILKNQDWWNKIDKNIVLGAIPLRQHFSEINKLGITHVLQVGDPYEFGRRFLDYVNWEEWKQAGIESMWLNVGNWDITSQGVKYIDQVLSRNPDAKIYIHCKPESGRGASLVIAYKIYNQMKSRMKKEELNLEIALGEKIEALKVKRLPYPGSERGASFAVVYKTYNQIKSLMKKEELNLEKALEKEIETLKVKTPQINLSKSQRSSILEFLKDTLKDFLRS